MHPNGTIYILGSGAIGFPLAAHLANAGRTVVSVRTSRTDVARGMVTVTVRDGDNSISSPIETISLSKLTTLDGMIVIAAKSYANKAIALELKDKVATGPIVIMQNGVGVEEPFRDAHISSLYRCILYVTSQPLSEYDFTFRSIAPSLIGIVNGDDSGLSKCVALLTTEGFPFRSEANIQREIWRKAIINATFNSLCPLLDVDSGIFVRNEDAASLALEVVREGVMLTDRLNMGLTESELMEQVLRVSKTSDGQLISTLQDIRIGRQTEVEFLNLELVRVAASLKPGLRLPRIELLGKMILARSLLQSHNGP